MVVVAAGSHIWLIHLDTGASRQLLQTSYSLGS
jgi:hypothetical protein